MDKFFELSVGRLVLAIICAVIVGMSKCGLPGASTLAIPMLASMFPARLSTGVMLPMLIMGDVMGVVHFNRHADWKVLLRLLAPSLLGIVLGYFLLGLPSLDDNAIRIIIAIIVLALAALGFFSDKLKKLLDGAGGRLMLACGLFFGLLAGLTTMLANAAGPVVLIYLLTMQLPKDAFLGTSAWFFFLLNLCKVPFMVHRQMITLTSVHFNFELFPFILLGAIIGTILSSKMSNRSFSFWVRILTVIAAVKLLF